MKLIFKLMLFVLILAAVLPFTPFMPGGKPILNLGDFKWPEFSKPPLPDLPNAKLPDIGKGTPSNNQSFYKWTDAEGNVHYSDKPPQQQVKSETVTVNPDTNVLAPVEVPKPQPKPSVPAQSAKDSEHLKNGMPNPYSPTEVKKLINDAKQLQQQAKERLKKMEQL